MREFASGQIKKGVRSIGFGGDGATWGNYGLVYREAGTALADVGITGYTNGNQFTFTAVGATTPPLWHGLAIYVIALSQHAEDLRLLLSSPALGQSRPMIGSGANQAFFTKIAAPLGHGIVGGRAALVRAVAVRRRDDVRRSGPRLRSTTRHGGGRREASASPGNPARASWSARARS